mmetsp:Transcript_25074/g.63026  ORF Transcript_25074/g.63026 Transcript_25074/m.63026 type:complete len:222 (+) Transcript_25074:528-1193(+)
MRIIEEGSECRERCTATKHCRYSCRVEDGVAVGVLLTNIQEEGSREYDRIDLEVDRKAVHDAGQQDPLARHRPQAGHHAERHHRLRIAARRHVDHKRVEQPQGGVGEGARVRVRDGERVSRQDIMQQRADQQVHQGKEELPKQGGEGDVGEEQVGEQGSVSVRGARVRGCPLRHEARRIREHNVVNVGVFHHHHLILPLSKRHKCHTHSGRHKVQEDEGGA